MTSHGTNDTLKFEKALRIFTPTLNAHNLYKLLSLIRKNVEWPKNKKNILKVHKTGSLKKLLACLSSDQSNIVAVSLSILGNCCLEANCSQQVCYTGLNELHNLLRRCPKEDSVVGRVFRILGNVFQIDMSHYILKTKSNIVDYVLNFIQNYVDDDNSHFSEPTILMAVRVMSKLLNRNSFSTLIDKHGMMKSIGALLVKCSQNWIEKKENGTVLEQIIKLLFMFSKYRYAPGINQLRNTSRGDSLVWLSRILSLAPQTIVNIIMNFLPASLLKSELPVIEMTSGLVKLLKDAALDKNEMNKEHKDYIKCLCFLLDAPTNRDPNRRDEIIPQLIRTLGDIQDIDNDKIELSCLILETFQRCLYHKNLLKLQLKHGILEVLCNKMENLLGSPNNLKMKHKLERKNIYKYSIASTRKNFWDSLPNSSDDDMDGWNSTSHSFGKVLSESEKITSSPWSSPRTPTPPAESSTFYLQESDSEDYSPVCSENEEDNPTPPMFKKNAEDIAAPEETLTINVQKISEEDLKYRLIHHFLSLIKIYSHMKPVPSELCLDTLILNLAKCACYFGRSTKATTMAKAILMKILSVNDFLIPLMETEVIYKIFDLSTTDHGVECEICSHFQDIGAEILNKLSDLIESGGCRGDIAHRLICGTGEQKKLLVMAIPYITRTKSTLQNLMVKCHGTKVLLKCLKDENYRKKIFEVLYVLERKHLNLRSPCQRGLFEEKMFLGNYEVPENCKNVVTFILDDNSCLSADRDALSEKSLFFSGLLNGSFKEGNAKYVKLGETNYLSLKHLIYLLTCDLATAVPKDIQLETHLLLDMILLCHRYLLDDLGHYLTSCVKQFCLSPENIPSIYKWSLESNTDILRLEAVTYALKGSTNQCDKSNMIEELFDLGFTEILIEDIEEVLCATMSQCFNKK